MRAVTAALALLSAIVWLMPARAEPQPVQWQDLRSSGQSPTNAALIDREIEIKGYLLPVDREGDNVYEFLLVPIAGACSHMPAPPPNQIIHISLRTPYAAREIYEPVAVRGLLKGEESKTQLFILDGVKVIDSAYSLGRANVAAATDMPPPVGLGNPLLSHRNGSKAPLEPAQ